MSLVPEWRYCFKCGRKWSYNPDVGHFSCPNCRENLNKKAKKMGKIFGNIGHTGIIDWR